MNPDYRLQPLSSHRNLDSGLSVQPILEQNNAIEPKFSYYNDQTKMFQ